MAIETGNRHGEPVFEVQGFAHLRASAAERARLLAGAVPFDGDAWRRNAVPPTSEELADLDEFLRELDETRRHSLERERLTDSSE